MAFWRALCGNRNDMIRWYLANARALPLTGTGRTVTVHSSHRGHLKVVAVLMVKMKRPTGFTCRFFCQLRNCLFL